MRIGVCVKAVPADPRERGFDPATLRLDRTGELVLNGADAHAVACACELRAAGAGADEIIAISVGPPGAEGAVRYALAMGADRAVLVSDPLLEGSDLLATGRVLARVIAEEACELVLFGQQGGDSNGALLWGAVAVRLDRPSISRATEIALDGGGVRVRRQTEQGFELVAAPLPCLVAVASGVAEPRPPTFRELKRAGDKPRRLALAAELGLDPGEVGAAGSRTTVLALGGVPRREGGRLVDGDPEEAAAEILELLVARGVV